MINHGKSDPKEAIDWFLREHGKSLTQDKLAGLVLNNQEDQELSVATDPDTIPSNYICSIGITTPAGGDGGVTVVFGLSREKDIVNLIGTLIGVLKK
jgi:hypothetical protein